MSENDTTTTDNAGPDRRWQFSLRRLLLLFIPAALFCAIFATWYPESLCPLFPLAPLLAVILALRWPVDRRRRVLSVPIIVVFLALVAGGSYFLSSHRETLCTIQTKSCRHNLQLIAQALHAYHAKQGTFPPAYIADKNGRPMHSWRVLILPYLGHEDLYRQYRFNEPWDSPHNSQLANATDCYVYVCPSAVSTGAPETNYMVAVQPDSLWPGAKCTRQQDIRDPPGATIMLVEVDGSGIHWMEPRDLDGATMPMTVNPPQGLGISSRHWGSGRHPRQARANVALADGETLCLPNNTPEKALRAMLTIAGGEQVDLPGLGER